jgi:hypothetical protein
MATKSINIADKVRLSAFTGLSPKGVEYLSQGLLKWGSRCPYAGETFQISEHVAWGRNFHVLIGNLVWNVQSKDQSKMTARLDGSDIISGYLQCQV